MAENSGNIPHPVNILEGLQRGDYVPSTKLFQDIMRIIDDEHIPPALKDYKQVVSLESMGDVTIDGIAGKSIEVAVKVDDKTIFLISGYLLGGFLNKSHNEKPKFILDTFIITCYKEPPNLSAGNFAKKDNDNIENSIYFQAAYNRSNDKTGGNMLVFYKNKRIAEFGVTQNGYFSRKVTFVSGEKYFNLEEWPSSVFEEEGYDFKFSSLLGIIKPGIYPKFIEFCSKIYGKYSTYAQDQSQKK